MTQITPFLWFDKEAEEAANYYVSVFPNSKLGAVARYGPGQPGPEGSVMTIAFELDGKPFVGLNGGPIFKFTEAVSFSIGCDDQATLDHYWERLSDGGEKGPCGWLKDRWGLSWQVVPSILPELFEGGGERANRVMAVVLASSKLDIAALKAAYDG